MSYLFHQENKKDADVEHRGNRRCQGQSSMLKRAHEREGKSDVAEQGKHRDANWCACILHRNRPNLSPTTPQVRRILSSATGNRLIWQGVSLVDASFKQKYPYPPVAAVALSSLRYNAVWPRSGSRFIPPLADQHPRCRSAIAERGHTIRPRARIGVATVAALVADLSVILTRIGRSGIGDHPTG